MNKMDHITILLAKTLLLSFLAIVSYVKSAEEPESRYIYPTKLITEDLVVSSDAAQVLSDSTQHSLPNGTLILVPAGNGFYHYAIIQYQFLDGSSIYALNLKNNSHELHLTDKIRILKFIPRLIYQPHPSKDFFITFFHTLLDHVSQEQEPQIIAKITTQEKHIILIGDLHGNSRALRHILFELYNKKLLNKDGILDSDILIIFTGDLADRGTKGPEVWDIALTLKSLNNNQVFILRGNHETIPVANYGNFLLQLERLTDCSKELITSSLKKLFSQLPLCLLLGIAPQPRKDTPETPYRFLMFCHGGIDPLINTKRLIQLLIQKHKSGNQDTLSLPAHHHNPDLSGLLWTDFRANYTDDELPARTLSPRGAGIHLLNSSAAMEFFDEHESGHPRHTYILDALLRGHQHLNGIGRLKTQAQPEQDWSLLANEESEIILPASIYTCTSSTRWVFDRDNYTVSYAHISFDGENRQWTLIPHTAFCHKTN